MEERVAVIGAGPIGLYTAYRLVKSGHCVVVWEKGVVAGNVAKWEHVTLFSALSLNLPADARADLEAGVGEALEDDMLLLGCAALSLSAADAPGRLEQALAAQEEMLGLESYLEVQEWLEQNE